MQLETSRLAVTEREQSRKSSSNASFSLQEKRTERTVKQLLLGASRDVLFFRLVDVGSCLRGLFVLARVAAVTLAAAAIIKKWLKIADAYNIYNTEIQNTNLSFVIAV